MFRFSMMVSTLIAASLSGCKSRAAVVPQPKAAPAKKVVAAPQQISKERAVEIVRELLAKESPAAVFDCKASESPDGFSVFVILGSNRDDSGRLEGTFPGGHCLYRLSKDGRVTEVIRGA